MKKVFLSNLVIAAFVVTAALTSCGKDGIDGETGAKGEQGEQGNKGDKGDAAVITISADGYWVINGEKTDVKAEGTKGEQGTSGNTPTVEISADGFWVINGIKTDVKAKGESGNDGKNSYLVIFNTNGGTPLFRIYGVSHGDQITTPAEPTKDGYIFDGWYTDEEFENVWNSANAVIANVIIYAKWEPIEVPFAIASTRYSATPVKVNDGKGGVQNYRLDYYFRYVDTEERKTYDVYYLYLGFVDWVPIASNMPEFWNGIQPLIELTPQQ